MHVFDQNQYRGAIALNNMGVALLRRHAYHQAVDTLRDAVFVMCNLMQSGGSLAQSEVDERLTRASRRLSNPLVAPHQVHLEVITQHGISHEEYECIETSQISFAVRIEDFDPELRDADLESSALLHNFALAHHCLAKNHQGQSKTRLEEGALRLSLSAYSIVNGLATEDDCFRSAIQQSSVFFLTVLIVSTHVHLLHDMGRVVEAKETDEKLATLRSLMKSESEEYCLEALMAAAA